MSKIAHHITLLIAVAGIMMVSCQKEVSGGDVEGPEDSTTLSKLSKAYWYYSGDTAAIPDIADTIEYTGNQLSKVTSYDLTFGGDPIVYEFQYNSAKQVSKIIGRVGTFGYDYSFHYSPAGRLDSAVVYEVDNGVGELFSVLTLEYVADALRKAITYQGVDRHLYDSAVYHRKNGKLDSFDIYHLPVAGGVEVTSKKLTSSATNVGSFSDIISSGYILTFTPDFTLSLNDDDISQFLNPKDLVLGNHITRKVMSGSPDWFFDVKHLYTFTSSNQVRTMIIESTGSGVTDREAFKFEYLK